MKKLIALLVPAMLVLGVATAEAAEKKGEITALDTANRTLTVGGNWVFNYPEKVSVDGLEVGDRVKVQFKIKGSGSKQRYIVKRVREI